MKQKRPVFKPYGLRARFTISLTASAMFCALVFLALYFLTNMFLADYFKQSGFTETHIRRQGESLQDYISENGISSANLDELKRWEYKQPLILLEIYSGDKCIYSSFYEGSEKKIFKYIADYKDEEHSISIRLADTRVSAILYSDFTYQYYVIGTVVPAIFALVLFILLFLLSNRKLIGYICRLNEEVQILEGGNLEYQVSVEGNDEITDLAKSMNRMRESFQQQMETEQALHRANKQLITEMSHDLRTPLTGIMLYLEILRSHRYTSEDELQDYLEKIDAKAHHMKQMSDHLFQYSLEYSKGGSKLYMKKMQDAFGDTLESFRDELWERGFSLVFELNWAPCFIQVNDEYIRRIFENIASNAVKYAEPSATITVSTLDTFPYCGISVLNACASSRLQEAGSGIGIESIRSMMREMNGVCAVEHTETAFEISLLFPTIS